MGENGWLLNRRVPPSPPRINSGGSNSPAPVLFLSECRLDEAGTRVREVKDMQPHFLGQVRAKANSSNTIPHRVQARRVSTDSQLPIDHRQNPSTHSTLGRDPNSERPLPREVVHSASKHDTQHIPDRIKTEHFFSSHWIRPQICQRRSHGSQVASIQEDGTLLKI